MQSEKVNSLKAKNLTDNTVIAIVSAQEWFKGFTKLPHFITKDDFVVCKWFEFNDKLSYNIEGKTTIAICRNKKDAELIFNSY